MVVSPGTGIEHWGTEFFGPRSSLGEAPGPQATMSDLNANETVVAHFHGTTQFQLFAAGSGTIGKGAPLPINRSIEFPRCTTGAHVVYWVHEKHEDAVFLEDADAPGAVGG